MDPCFPSKTSPGHGTRVGSAVLPLLQCHMLLQQVTCVWGCPAPCPAERLALFSEAEREPALRSCLAYIWEGNWARARETTWETRNHRASWAEPGQRLLGPGPRSANLKRTLN